MIAQAEIRQLPLAEKIALLEAVWTELSADPEQVEIPQWHKDLLDERQRAVEEGRVAVLDWDEAKRQIEKSLR